MAAVADGYASNVGSGATDAGAMALSAATSGALRVLVQGVPEHVPTGLWCYRVDRRRSLLGGAPVLGQTATPLPICPAWRASGRTTNTIKSRLRATHL